jgi:hypothetical protein
MEDSFQNKFTQVNHHIYIHLEVFNCLTYIYISREKSRKLRLRAEQRIFVGYNDVSKAYQVYNPQIWKIVVTKDVIFNESLVGFNMLWE